MMGGGAGALRQRKRPSAVGERCPACRWRCFKQNERERKTDKERNPKTGRKRERTQTGETAAHERAAERQEREKTEREKTQKRPPCCAHCRRCAVAAHLPLPRTLPPLPPLPLLPPPPPCSLLPAAAAEPQPGTLLHVEKRKYLQSVSAGVAILEKVCQKLTDGKRLEVGI